MKLDLTHYPLWLKALCILFLLPILGAPLVFYGTIFFFDHPSSEAEAYLMFFVVNSYSFVLLAICGMSVWLYAKYKKNHIAMLPFLGILAVIGGVYIYMVHGPIDKKKVADDDYRLFRDTPCEALAKAVYWENTSEVGSILSRSPQLLAYKEPLFHQNIFFYALMDDKIRSLKIMLERGETPNQIRIYQYDPDMSSMVMVPLTWVCDQYADEKKKIELVRMLLDYGADVNIRFVEDSIKGHDYQAPDTPLMAATQHGDLQLVRFLLEKGADPNHRLSELDAPPLQYALIFDHYEVAEVLLHHGANPDQRFYERNTSVREELINDIRRAKSAHTERDVKDKVRLLRLIQSLDKTGPQH